MTLATSKKSLEESRDAVLAQYEAPAADFEKAYGPGKWTVHQILVHLADCEAVFLWRLYRTIAEPGSSVAGFDQDAWANKLQYSKRALGPCKDLFRAARNLVLEHLERVDDAALTGSAVQHSEAGRLTLGQLLDRYDQHTWHHLDQIKAARADKTWIPEK